MFRRMLFECQIDNTQYPMVCLIEGAVYWSAFRLTVDDIKCYKNLRTGKYEFDYWENRQYFQQILTNHNYSYFEAADFHFCVMRKSECPTNRDYWYGADRPQGMTANEFDELDDDTLILYAKFVGMIA